MNRSQAVAIFQKMRQKQIAQYQNHVKLTTDNINKIASNSLIIKYYDLEPTDIIFLKAFDYVNNLFPECKVKEATIYKCSRAYLDSLGYKSAAGFFCRLKKVVVIPDKLDFSEDPNSIWGSVKCTATIDEVIVHELLHYCSDRQDNYTTSVNIEEEFAYGNSIGYLKQKGYTKDEIIKNNFMPYLINSVDYSKFLPDILVKNGYHIGELEFVSENKKEEILKKLEKQIFKQAWDRAWEKGEEIIKIYSSKRFKMNNRINDNSKDFDFIDLE